MSTAGNLGKGFGKSIAFGINKSLKNKLPAVYDIANDQNKEFVANIKNTLSEIASSQNKLNKIAEIGMGAETLDAIKSVKTNFGKSIDNLKKTGEISRPEAEVEKEMFDFGDEESLDFSMDDMKMDDLPSPEDAMKDLGIDASDIEHTIAESSANQLDAINTGNKAIVQIGAKTASNVAALTSATIDQTTVIADGNAALIKSNVAMNENSIAVMQAHQSQTLECFKTINENVANIITWHNDVASEFFKSTGDYYTKSLDELHKISSILERAYPENNDQYNDRQSQRDRLGMGYNESLNLGEYWKQIKYNVENNTTFGSMLSMIDADQIKMMAANPLEVIAEQAADYFMDKGFEKALKKTNEVIQEFIPGLLLKLGTAGADWDDNSVFAQLGKIFGITAERSSNNFGNYEKGQVPFDGITHKTINQVIPNYLSAILKAISGNDKVYDYTTAKFIDRKVLNDREKRNTEYVRNDALGEKFVDSAKETLRTIDFGSRDTEDQYAEELNKALNKIVESGKFVDLNNDKFLQDITDNGIIQGILQYAGTQIGKKERMHLGNASLTYQSNMYDNNKNRRRPDDFGAEVYQNGLYDMSQTVTDRRRRLSRDEQDSILSDRNWKVKTKGKYELINGNLYEKLKDIEIKSNTEGGMLDTFKDGINGTHERLDTIANILSEISIDTTHISDNVNGFGGGTPNNGNPPPTPARDRNSELKDFRARFKLSNISSNDEELDTVDDMGGVKFAERNRNVARDKVDFQDIRRNINPDTSMDSGATETRNELIERLKMIGEERALEAENNLLQEDNDELEEENKTDREKFFTKLFKWMQSPQKMLVHALESVDSTLYSMLFDEKDEFGNKSIVGAIIVNIKDSFNKFMETFKTEFLNPLKLWFVSGPIGNIFKEIRDDFRGVDKGKGVYEGGYLSGVWNMVTGRKTEEEQEKEAADAEAREQEENNKETERTNFAYGGTVKVNDRAILKDKTPGKGRLIWANEGETIIPAPGVSKKAMLKEEYKSQEGLLNNIMNGEHYADGGKVGSAQPAKKKKKEDSQLVADIKNKVNTLTVNMARDVLDHVFGWMGFSQTNDKGEKMSLKDQIASTFVRSANRLSNLFFGTHLKENATAKEYAEKFKKAMPAAVGKGLVGGAVIGIGQAVGAYGLIGSLFLPGGPIGAALLGMGIGFASESEGIKKFLFGKKDKDGNRTGGLVSKKVINFINDNKKLLIGAAGAGILGAMGLTPLSALVGLIPGGGLVTSMVTGLIGTTGLSLAAGLALKSKVVQERIFGKTDEKTGRKTGGLVQSAMMKNIKKAIPHAVTGAVLGAGASLAFGGILGPLAIGPYAAAITGGAIGLGTASNKFKEALFGKWDEKKQAFVKGGLVDKMGNLIKAEVVNPIKNFMAKEMFKANVWFRKNVVNKIADAMTPYKIFIKSIFRRTGKEISNIFKQIGKTIQGIFNPFFKPFQMLFKSLLSSMKSTTSFLSSTLLGGARTGIGAVVSAITAPSKFLAMHYRGDEKYREEMKAFDEARGRRDAQDEEEFRKKKAELDKSVASREKETEQLRKLNYDLTPEQFAEKTANRRQAELINTLEATRQKAEKQRNESIEKIKELNTKIEEIQNKGLLIKEKDAESDTTVFSNAVGTQQYFADKQVDGVWKRYDANSKEWINLSEFDDQTIHDEAYYDAMAKRREKEVNRDTAQLRKDLASTQRTKHKQDNRLNRIDTIAAQADLSGEISNRQMTFINTMLDANGKMGLPGRSANEAAAVLTGNNLISNNTNGGKKDKKNRVDSSITATGIRAENERKGFQAKVVGFFDDFKSFVKGEKKDKKEESWFDKLMNFLQGVKGIAGVIGTLAEILAVGQTLKNLWDKFVNGKELSNAAARTASLVARRAIRKGLQLRARSAMNDDYLRAKRKEEAEIRKRKLKERRAKITDNVERGLNGAVRFVLGERGEDGRVVEKNILGKGIDFLVGDKETGKAGLLNRSKDFVFGDSASGKQNLLRRMIGEKESRTVLGKGMDLGLTGLKYAHAPFILPAKGALAVGKFGAKKVANGINTLNDIRLQKKFGVADQAIFDENKNVIGYKKFDYKTGKWNEYRPDEELTDKFGNKTGKYKRYDPKTGKWFKFKPNAKNGLVPRTKLDNFTTIEDMRGKGGSPIEFMKSKAKGAGKFLWDGNGVKFGDTEWKGVKGVGKGFGELSKRMGGEVVDLAKGFKDYTVKVVSDKAAQIAEGLKNGIEAFLKKNGVQPEAVKTAVVNAAEKVKAVPMKAAEVVGEVPKKAVALADNMISKVTGVAGALGKKAGEAVGEAGAKVLESDVGKAIAAEASKGKGIISKMVDKAFNAIRGSKVVQEKLGSEGVKKFTGMLSGVVNKALKNDSIIGKITKKLSAAIGRTALGTGTGGLVSLAFAAYDAYTGYNEVASMFGVPPEKVTAGMKTAAMVFNVIMGLPYVNIIDLILEVVDAGSEALMGQNLHVRRQILTTIYTCLPNSLNEEELEKLQNEQHAKYEEYKKKYMEEHGITDEKQLEGMKDFMTEDQFNEKEEDNYSPIMDAVRSTKMGAFLFGTKDENGNVQGGVMNDLKDWVFGNDKTGKESAFTRAGRFLFGGEETDKEGNKTEVEGVIPKAIKAVGNGITAISDFFSSVYDFFMNKTFEEKLDCLWTTLIGGKDEAGEYQLGLFPKLWGAMGDFVDGMVETVKTSFTPFATAIYEGRPLDAWAQFYQGVLKVFGIDTSLLQDGVNTAWNSFTEMLNTFIGSGTSGFSELTQPIAQLIDDFSKAEGFSAKLGVLNRFIRSMFDIPDDQGTISGVMSKLKDAVANFGNKVSQTFNEACDWIFNKSADEKFKSVLKAILPDSLSKRIDDTFDFAKTPEGGGSGGSGLGPGYEKYFQGKASVISQYDSRVAKKVLPGGGTVADEGCAPIAASIATGMDPNEAIRSVRRDDRPEEGAGITGKYFGHLNQGFKYDDVNSDGSDLMTHSGIVGGVSPYGGPFTPNGHYLATKGGYEQNGRKYIRTVDPITGEQKDYDYAVLQAGVNMPNSPRVIGTFTNGGGDGSENQIVAWAMSKLGQQWMGGRVNDASIQCDSFTAEAYKQAGISSIGGVSTDGFIPDTPFRNAGAYHPYGDGYKPRAGDLIDSPGHVGLVVGDDKYIARNSTGGVTLMDGATWKSYFNGIDGFGDIRKATGREFPDYKGGTFTGSSSSSGDSDGKSQLADVGSKLTTIFTNYVNAIMAGKRYTGTDFSKKDGTNGGNNSSTLTSANIKKLQDIANRASKIAGLPADWLYAQLCHESGGGTSELATVYHNYGGLTVTGGMPTAGKQPDGSGNYGRWDSDEAFADYYGKYLTYYRSDGIYDAKTVDEFADALKRGKYYGASPETYKAGMHRYLSESGIKPTVIGGGSGLGSVTENNKKILESIYGSKPITGSEKVISINVGKAQKENVNTSTEVAEEVHKKKRNKPNNWLQNIGNNISEWWNTKVLGKPKKKTQTDDTKAPAPVLTNTDKATTKAKGHKYADLLAQIDGVNAEKNKTLIPEAVKKLDMKFDGLGNVVGLTPPSHSVILPEDDDLVRYAKQRNQIKHYYEWGGKDKEEAPAANEVKSKSSGKLDKLLKGGLKTLTGDEPANVAKKNNIQFDGYGNVTGIKIPDDKAKDLIITAEDSDEIKYQKQAIQIANYDKWKVEDGDKATAKPEEASSDKKTNVLTGTNPAKEISRENLKFDDLGNVMGISIPKQFADSYWITENDSASTRSMKQAIQIANYKHWKVKTYEVDEETKTSDSNGFNSKTLTGDEPAKLAKKYNMQFDEYGNVTGIKIPEDKAKDLLITAEDSDEVRYQKQAVQIANYTNWRVDKDDKKTPKENAVENTTRSDLVTKALTGDEPAKLAKKYNMQFDEYGNVTGIKIPDDKVKDLLITAEDSDEVKYQKQAVQIANYEKWKIKDDKSTSDSNTSTSSATTNSSSTQSTVIKTNSSAVDREIDKVINSSDTDVIRAIKLLDIHPELREMIGILTKIASNGSMNGTSTPKSTKAPSPVAPIRNSDGSVTSPTTIPKSNNTGSTQKPHKSNYSSIHAKNLQIARGGEFAAS